MASRGILLLITDLEIGGTPTVVRELAIRLQTLVSDVRIEAACLSAAGPVAREIEAAGIHVTALNALGVSDFRILPRFIHLVRARGFDTVFSFLLHANAVAAAASIWLGDVRWVQSIQTTQPWPRWHWMVQRLAHRAADCVVVPSQSVSDAAVAWSNVPEEKIVIIPNAVDPSGFVPNKTVAAVSIAHPFPITFIGRLDPIKNVPTLIEAVALLRGLVHLHVWGLGTDRPRIEAAIRRHQASQWVTMHGAAAGPMQALSESGMLVLPSLAEGFGLVLIEAMAAGVPVVATDVAGIRDVVRHEQTGLLVPSSNAAALAAAIQRLAQDRALRQRLIAAGGQDVRRRFTWDAVLPQYRSVLRI